MSHCFVIDDSLPGNRLNGIPVTLYPNKRISSTESNLLIGMSIILDCKKGLSNRIKKFFHLDQLKIFIRSLLFRLFGYFYLKSYLINFYKFLYFLNLFTLLSVTGIDVSKFHHFFSSEGFNWVTYFRVSFIFSRQTLRTVFVKILGRSSQTLETVVSVFCCFFFSLVTVVNNFV